MAALSGKITVVTGASRGAGRGIAVELGAAGATVYITGRSAHALSTQGRRETIEQTAQLVSEAGGTGIPVRCDHAVDDEVEELFQQIEAEQGRLDLLVNNAWGGYERTLDMGPFWEIPLKEWDVMFRVGLRSHLVASRFAVPLLRKSDRGLIVHTTSPVGEAYHGNLFYDVCKRAVQRMALGMGADLRPHGVAVVSLAPGWMRTERVLEHYHATEEKWTEVPDLAPTESPRYSGRAVVALAGDEKVMERTGQTHEVGHLATAYGFTDIDGRTPQAFSDWQ